MDFVRVFVCPNCKAIYEFHSRIHEFDNETYICNDEDCVGMNSIIVFHKEYEVD